MKNATPAQQRLPVRSMPPGQQQLPDKVYFRIGEVSALVGVDTHVLRYWETEFPGVRPHRAKSKQRLYRKQDVKLLLLIKQLLHEDGYTISGARKLLKSRRRNQNSIVEENVPGDIELGRLGEIKGELQDILGILSVKSRS